MSLPLSSSRADSHGGLCPAVFVLVAMLALVGLTIVTSWLPRRLAARLRCDASRLFKVVLVISLLVTLTAPRSATVTLPGSYEVAILPQWSLRGPPLSASTQTPWSNLYLPKALPPTTLGLPLPKEVVMPDVVQMPNPAASEAAPTIIFVDSAVDDLSVSTDSPHWAFA